MFRFNEFCSSMFLAIVSIFFTSPNAIYGLYSFFSFIFFHFVCTFSSSFPFLGHCSISVVVAVAFVLFCVDFFVFFFPSLVCVLVLLLYSLDERIVCCSSLLCVFLSLLLQDNIRCLLPRMQMHFERNA